MPVLPPLDSVDPLSRVTSLDSQFPRDLIGLPLAGLRLSWKVASDTAGSSQVGYQLSSRSSASADFIDAEPVAASSAIGITGPGGALASRERRDLRVRIATAAGWTAWSDVLSVEAGIGSHEFDDAVIGLDSTIEGPVAHVRTTFTLSAAPRRARLYVSSLGLNEVWLNGAKVGEEFLSPGWTSYQERILIEAHDVTEQLHSGENAIGALIGDGWYRGRMGFANRVEIYGTRIGVKARLEVELEDGSHVTVVTDESWRAGFGAVQGASIYDGTTIDFTRDVGDWTNASFDDSAWSPVSVIPADPAHFAPRVTAPVRQIGSFDMVATAKPDRVLFDAGQNVSGWVRLTVRGTAGQVVTVRHAEILDPAGDMYTAALRTAKATDTYTLGHDGESVLEPVFTFHGFRYADVVTEAEVVAATAIAISSDLAPRSRFESSHAALNQFHSNVTWSQRDNFVSVPTDCPQRDERLGWTGDAQAFAATANTLFDSESFWRSWLVDLEIDQTDDTGVASVVPNIIDPAGIFMGGHGVEDMGRAGWADAATIVPLSVYESYGSTEVLEQQLGSMRRWVEHLRRRAGSGVVLPSEGFQYGDWLDPDAPGDRPWEAKVDSYFVANAFYVHSTRLLAVAERLVGDAAKADEYDALAARVAEATWQQWGEAAVTTQTGAALALEFHIAPDADRERIADLLAANVRNENGRISTGFLGTPLVLYALSTSGHLTEAYQMLLRREAPSWLYQVDRGATTVWERWDAILPDGSIHSGSMDTTEGDSMLSFNHYAYGAMIDWVYRTVAGIAPTLADPGYQTVVVAPRPAPGLDWARASVDTRLGELAIDWHLDEAGTLLIDLDVPFGSTARLDLPVTDGSQVTIEGSSASPSELGHGRHSISITHPSIVSAASVTSN